MSGDSLLGSPDKAPHILLSSGDRRARLPGGKAGAMLEARKAHMDDERIEKFLRDVLHLEGETPARIREGMRFAIAVYERMFREAEPDDRKKDEAAKKCRTLCREGVVEAIERRKGTPTEAHLQIVLRVLGGSARFPLND